MKQKKLKIQKQKKAEVASQIFVYIIALVVVGLVVVFGYKAIKNFAARSDEVALIKFKTDVEGAFKTVSTSFNTIKVETFEIPLGYEEICLVNIDFNSQLQQQDFSYNPLLWEGVEEKKNLFLIKGVFTESYYVGKITVDSDNSYPPPQGSPLNPHLGGDKKENAPGKQDGYLLCAEAKSGKIKLRLKGKGDGVFVSLAD